MTAVLEADTVPETETIPEADAVLERERVPVGETQPAKTLHRHESVDSRSDGLVRAPRSDLWRPERGGRIRKAAVPASVLRSVRGIAVALIGVATTLASALRAAADPGFHTVAACVVAPLATVVLLHCVKTSFRDR